MIIALTATALGAALIGWTARDAVGSCRLSRAQRTAIRRRLERLVKQ